MKRTATIFLLCCLLSCGKSGDDIVFLEGTYIGYFHHNHADTTRVTLRFLGNHFEGESTDSRHPALCRGSVEQDEATLRFRDSCNRHFSPGATLVLNGPYNYEFNNDGTLRIWRSSESALDEYILRTPIRQEMGVVN
jgi:hypothetical protein